MSPPGREKGRRAHLFGLQAHAGRGDDGRMAALPGFERPHGKTPALPLALYDLGGGGPERSAGPAPLALRLFVESLLAFSLEDRSGGPVYLEITLRGLLSRLYPGDRQLRPNEYLPRLEAAVDAVNTFRFPRRDPVTGKGGLYAAVFVRNLPTRLDDVLEVEVKLPAGSDRGPQIPASLGAYGTQSAAAYRGLLNLAYLWHNPGRTWVPVKGGHWIRSYDPERYEVLDDADRVDVFLPTTAIGRHDHRVEKAKGTMTKLEQAGELQVITLNRHERRIQPPYPPARPPAQAPDSMTLPVGIQLRLSFATTLYLY